jgi:hypothetical protein
MPLTDDINLGLRNAIASLTTAIAELGKVSADLFSASDQPTALAIARHSAWMQKTLSELMRIIGRLDPLKGDADATD